MTASVFKGKKRILPFKRLDETYSTVTYQSENKTIAIVSSKGVVKGKQVGTLILVTMVIDPKDCI